VKRSSERNAVSTIARTIPCRSHVRAAPAVPHSTSAVIATSSGRSGDSAHRPGLVVAVPRRSLESSGGRNREHDEYTNSGTRACALRRRVWAASSPRNVWRARSLGDAHGRPLRAGCLHVLRSLLLERRDAPERRRVSAVQCRAVGDYDRLQRRRMWDGQGRLRHEALSQRRREAVWW